MTEEVSAIIRLDEQVSISPSYGSVIPLNDGRLMWIWSNFEEDAPFKATYSSDGGRTWSDPVVPKLEDGSNLPGLYESNLFRLPSGALGFVQNYRFDGRGGPHESMPTVITFQRSNDEGRTWSVPQPIHGREACVFQPSNDVCTVLKDGRIIVPISCKIGPTPGDEDIKAYYRFGERFHAGFGCGLWYSRVYYSDDDGQTWSCSDNEVIVTLDKGAAGCYSFEEPTVIELKDGRLLMFGRVMLGRVFQSISEDRGVTWSEPEPTDLVASPAPTRLRRIPETGDLLVIWTQMSKWESMIGLYRHRLSCAISKDEGKTWQHHKNLESLDDTQYIAPEPIEPFFQYAKPRQPLDRVRYHRAPGPLRCNDATCTFLDGHAIITYCYQGFGDKSVITDTYGMDYDDVMRRHGLAPYDRANKVRVLPIEWFYN